MFHKTWLRNRRRMGGLFREGDGRAVLRSNSKFVWVYHPLGMAALIVAMLLGMYEQSWVHMIGGAVVFVGISVIMFAWADIQNIVVFSTHPFSQARPFQTTRIRSRVKVWPWSALAGAILYMVAVTVM